MNKIPEEDNSDSYKLPIQKITAHSKANHRSRESSLPIISSQKDQKVNQIRRQLQERNNEVSIAKARINALSNQKAKNDQKKAKNLKQIESMRTIRERMFQDHQFKESFRSRRQSEVVSLRNKANQMRENMTQQRQMARSIASLKNTGYASQERKRHRQDQQYIAEMRQLEQEQNRLKAQEIKRAEQEQQAKMRFYQESRLVLAKKNHESRVVSSLREKKRADRVLKSLRKKQDSLIMTVKQAENQMMETLYELETLNPEAKGRRFRASRTIEVRH